MTRRAYAAQIVYLFLTIYIVKLSFCRILLLSWLSWRSWISQCLHVKRPLLHWTKGLSSSWITSVAQIFCRRPGNQPKQGVTHYLRPWQMFRAKNLKLEELDLAKQSWRYDRMPEIPASNYRSIAWTIYDEKREAFKILIEVTRRPSSFRNEDCGIVISQTLAYIAFILQVQTLVLERPDNVLLPSRIF